MKLAGKKKLLSFIPAVAALIVGLLILSTSTNIYVMLAGIAVGVFESASDAVEKCVKAVDITYPNLENTPKYRKVFEDYKKIHDALAPIYQERN